MGPPAVSRRIPGSANAVSVSVYHLCPCTSVVFSSALQCFHLYLVRLHIFVVAPCSFAVVLHLLHDYIHMVMFSVLIIFLFVIFSTAIF